MKVAFLVSRVVRTGPNTNMMGVLRHLPRSAVRAEVLALDATSDQAMVEELRRGGITTHLIAGRGLGAKIRSLRQVLTEREYRLVASCGIRADIVNLLSTPRPQRVVIKQEPAFTPYGGRLKTALVRLWHLAIISRARTIVSVSRHVHDTLPGMVRRRSVVIPNAIDLDRFRPPSAEERRQAREKLDLSLDSEIVAFAGTLDSRKRPHLIAEAVGELRAGGRPVELVIAGDGPMKEALASLPPSSGVRLIGFLDDVRPLLWAADAFALPSTHEGLPLAAMEALACELPLVLSDIPPHRELLDGCEAAGSVVDVTSSSALQQAISDVLDRAGAEAPRRLAEARLGAPTMSRRYAELFLSLRR